MARFTEQERGEIAERYRAGEGLKDVSAAFHTSDRQIKAVLVDAAVPLRKAGRPPSWLSDQEIDAEILRLHAQGMGQVAIARRLHVRSTRIPAVLKTAGVKPRPQWNPKFTPATEAEITRRHQAGESTKALAAEYGCCTVTVQHIARRNGGKTNPRGNRYREFSAADIAEMKRRWEAGESQHAIGRALGVNQTTVSRVLLGQGIEKETRLQRGEGHGNWKGGRIQVNGYVMVRLAVDHPFGEMRLRGGYVMEHRLVMAEHLGRLLDRHEYVHHINGVKTDNRLENLQLMSASHTKGQTMCCADCGSRNIIACPLT